MGWHQVPEFKSAASSKDKNFFASPRSQASGRISVKLPSDDWLCWNGLSKDQFVKVPHTQKWYDVYSRDESLFPVRGNLLA